MAKVTRESIIDAAVELFHRNGYHATSMRDIAQFVKIKKPSLYHHFNSKEDILLEILKMGMDHLISELERIVATDADPIAKLHAAICAHAGAIATNPAAASVFLREDRGLGVDYLKMYVSKRDHFESLFRSILQQGIDEGFFRATDITIAVQGLLGMVNWMTRWYRPEGRLSISEVSDMFADLFLRGILSPAHA